MTSVERPAQRRRPCVVRRRVVPVRRGTCAMLRSAAGPPLPLLQLPVLSYVSASRAACLVLPEGQTGLATAGRCPGREAS